MMCDEFPFDCVSFVFSEGMREFFILREFVMFEFLRFRICSFILFLKFHSIFWTFKKKNWTQIRNVLWLEILLDLVIWDFLYFLKITKLYVLNLQKICMILTLLKGILISHNFSQKIFNNLIGVEIYLINFFGNLLSILGNRFWNKRFSKCNSPNRQNWSNWNTTTHSQGPSQAHRSTISKKIGILQNYILRISLNIPKLSQHTHRRKRNMRNSNGKS